MKIDLSLAPPSAEEIKDKIAEYTGISKSLRKTMWLQTALLVGVNFLASFLLLFVFGKEYFVGIAVLFFFATAIIMFADIEYDEDFGWKVGISLLVYLTACTVAYFRNKGVDHDPLPYIIATIVHVASYLPLTHYLSRTRKKKHDADTNLEGLSNISNENCGEILMLKSKYSVIDTYITSVQKSGRILVVAEEEAMYAYHKSAAVSISKEQKEAECRELHFGKMMADV